MSSAKKNMYHCQVEKTQIERKKRKTHLFPEPLKYFAYDNVRTHWKSLDKAVPTSVLTCTYVSQRKKEKFLLTIM